MSKKNVVIVFAVVCCMFVGIANDSFAEDVFVKMETTKGTMILQLYKDKAPKTVDNFVQYVKDKFYDYTIFHRVIKDFMNQGGYLDVSKSTESNLVLTPKATRAAIVNESDNGLSNLAYTIAMARTSQADSATSQFFINAVDNIGLDKKYAQDKVGYAVFGKVVDGKSVVDAINVVPTATISGLENMPTTPVVVNKATVINSPVCFEADDTLAIKVSCAQFRGSQYGFTINPTSVPSDPKSYYWKLNVPTFSAVQPSKDACMPVGDDVKLNLCAEYHGVRYEFVLNQTPVPGDPTGYYWKADFSAFKQRN